MLHNNAAQQRPGEKPASAPKALQIIPRAQGRAYIPISTLKQRSRHEDTQAASLTDENMDTHIIHIRGARGDRARNATQACNAGTAAKNGTKQAQRNTGQHSGYSNSSLHTLHTAEILQQANGCRKEEARTSTLCMAWHAQRICGRSHSASTTSDAAGGVAMRVQYKQGQTAKER